MTICVSLFFLIKPAYKTTKSLYLPINLFGSPYMPEQRKFWNLDKKWSHYPGLTLFIYLRRMIQSIIEETWEQLSIFLSALLILIFIIYTQDISHITPYSWSSSEGFGTSVQYFPYFLAIIQGFIKLAFSRGQQQKPRK